MKTLFFVFFCTWLCLSNADTTPMTTLECPDQPSCNEKTDPNRYCPVDAIGLCTALEQDSNTTWLMVSANVNPCPDVKIAPITYKTQDLTYGETFIIDSDTTSLVLRCPKDSPFYNRQVHDVGIFDLDGKPCIDEKTLSFSANWIKDTTTRIRDIEFDIHYADDGVSANFKYKAVIFGPNIQLGTTDSGNFTCSLYDPPNGFQFTQVWWTKKNTGTKPLYYRVLEDTDPSDHVFTAPIDRNDTDEYRCHAEIGYHVCDPDITLTRVIDSNAVIVGSAQALAVSMGLLIFTHCLLVILDYL